MKAYAIKDPKGNLMVETSSEYIVGSRQAIVYLKEENWEDLEEIGYRCVPVVITEVNI